MLNEIISISSADSLFLKPLSVFGENGTLLPCYRVLLITGLGGNFFGDPPDGGRLDLPDFICNYGRGAESVLD